MTLVSVIIPCYNSHHYLKDAIDSIKGQTYKNIEIIIVNDGSTDPETIAFLEQLDQTTKILNKPNGGLSSARNFGIDHSQGEIIVPLDSDDRFAPAFIEETVAILDREKETGIVSSHVQEFGNSNKVWRTTAYDDFSFLTENRIVACSAFRKICWAEAGGYDEEMRSGYEDWEFWIRITKKGWKVHVIPKPLFFYRKQDSSMLVTETRPRMNEILEYMMKKHQDWFMSSLRKGIAGKHLINKKNLTVRRIIGLLAEKIKGKF